MKQVVQAFITDAGVLFVETKNLGLDPYIPLHPVADMLEKLGCEYEARQLRALIVSE